ncbi:unnamed protein product [Parascedosporium putredinis]|uniref:Argonaute linker 1 domain-containing protein n=1 Tax=Parascedosporium putredinis TaxID=1442378 RepID=A0A9P1HAF7_9PEZI|nr:unnamed protein product [Parascedosporium putredinis]CAI8003991.1 unnamed protein product [Parascedosporium putredinis]
MGYDPAKPEPTSKEKVNVRVDLPPEAYLKTPIDSRFTKRPGFNTNSRPISVHVNQFSVKSIDPDQKIYQYDTTQIDMRALKSYLSGTSAWDNTVLECMNFLDHLIRQRPSENLLAIKRNFYNLNEPRRPLTNGTFNEVATGAYASIRLCQIKPGGTGLGINVDVANTAMWTGGQSLLALVQAYLPSIDRRFSNYGRRISVQDYFYQRYNTTLHWPDLPVIETTKKGCYMPMELCWIKPMQRFPFKLSGAQTSDMIRIAVTRPPVRRTNIMQKFASLDYQNDHYLHQYGVRIDNHFTATDARLLKPPVLQFNRSKIEPGTSGRWDLKGKKLFVSNTRPLKTWGFVRFTNVVDFPLMAAFARQFKQFFIQHGGVVSDDPLYFDATRGGSLAAALKSAHDQWQQKKGSKVDLMFCIISKGKEDIYTRLKKSADCRLAVLTQMLLDENVVKSTLNIAATFASR